MSSSASTNPGSSPKALWLWVLWLALSLLLSHSLGQLHAVKHGGLAAVAHLVGEREANEVHHGHDGEGDLDILFSSHDSASDCRLYDQMCDGHAMPLFLAAPLPIVLPSVLVAIFAGDALARWDALFDARGPPLTF